ncbi:MULTISPECIES: DUF3541 domain-containing protein [Shewanella]|uniref:DUF3541 domain-containing protein n=1 Tax=Shewanella TaxID=22 RepID=UPI00048E0F44|nr:MULTISPECIES: DUF3541 domain-containing protein [Shewanella]QLE85687.1 DUF3541 domain-containing protein [Shewanella sp. Scap07]
MHKLLKTSTLVLALLSVSPLTYAEKQAQAVTEQQVYQGIKMNLENHLYQLPPRVQGHYGIRQFRMTGDEKYANAALIDLYAVTESQAFYACQLDKPGFIESESKRAISVLGNGPRAKARKKALKPFPEFLFYTDVLLRFSSRIDEFGLVGPCDDKLRAALKKTDLRQGLTDKAMIEAWAAQLINYVYWAKQIGVGDYVDEYKAAFNEVYPSDKDEQLSTRQYRNKIYGLTHFIFAASEYYQHRVDVKEFAWILDYFDANIERILEDATDDIIAEVGISFHLAGLSDHRVVKLTQAHIVNAYDVEANIIKSPRGNPDLALGEHRNVLAMMLLQWPEKLHKGPYFHKLKATKKYLPKQVSEKP